MLAFHVERWGQYAQDAEKLWHEHYAEIATDKSRMAMAPNGFQFGAMDMVGTLLICTARRDGRMIGYVIFNVIPHMHYAGTTCAFEDAYFLTADERVGRGLNFRAQTGVKLIEFALDRARERGAKKVFFHTKEVRSVAVVLRRLGMTKCDEVFTMWLEDI